MNPGNNSRPENPKRRDFLKILGVGAVGALVAVKGNKILENKYEQEELMHKFKDQEWNFSRVHEAAGLLRKEIENPDNGISSVEPYGSWAPSSKIGILRDFLTRHMNSKFGKHYSFSAAVRWNSPYTVDILVQLEEETKKKTTLKVNP